MVKIYLGSDHAGFNLKKRIVVLLKKKGIEYEDLGGFDRNKSDDYPDYAFKVAKKVAKDKNSKGILICGGGTGMAIAANKVKGIRAVVAYDDYSAKSSREDNNTNVLCLRGRKFPIKKSERIVSIWLKTKFSGISRHERRIKKIDNFRK